ncbi:MAG: DUF3769 domain-containing protein [Leptolyngbyaceae cyanobacterium SU_3_3]|nr:DUF3769 domain-containing protein [Leptolyngbyaceae cyanobacterium SU_3_3]
MLRNRVILDRNQRQPALVNFGFDSTDRGGIFVEREIEVLQGGNSVYDHASVSRAKGDYKWRQPL